MEKRDRSLQEFGYRSAWYLQSLRASLSNLRHPPNWETSLPNSVCRAVHGWKVEDSNSLETSTCPG